MEEGNLELIEKEIEVQQRNVSYDTKEYTIEIIVDKYLNGLDNEENEFFVPDYQREFVWDELRQSRFIESLIMGLPIPYIFLAENADGWYEIVDGSQRIRTLAAFIKDELEIVGLEKIRNMNGLKFSQLKISRQRKFRNISLKMITLSEHTSDETKNDIFERINRGSDLLKDMEKRKGIYWGPFNDFIYLMAKNEDYIRLTPVAHWFENRQEREELLLRYFAFSEWYPNFKDGMGIALQLDKYMEMKNKMFTNKEKERIEKEFYSMLNFVDENLRYGFAKNNTNQISRQYFEAISVGVCLALREKSNLKVHEGTLKRLASDHEFHQLMAARYHTHKPQKIRMRIDYIKDGLLSDAKSF